MFIFGLCLKEILKMLESFLHHRDIKLSLVGTNSKFGVCARFFLSDGFHSFFRECHSISRKLHGSRSINEKSHACLAKCL